MQIQAGTLSIVATPIGNLKDMTYHAVEILKSVDLIAAEDTRHTKILTAHYDIHTPMTSYFEHNQFTKGEYLIDQLKSGKNIALVSDAGTPGISDPGYRLIRMAIEEAIPLRIIPGACALVAGLVVSGKPTDRFVFAGFLPPKTIARKKRLAELKAFDCTLILYESPYRLVKTLVDIQEVFGDVSIACTRELTKKFEEVLRKPVSRLIMHFQSIEPKGEFVLVI